ncbi:MAG: transposase [Coriobacteriia bacterium]|nr:transposase [Coriobacteriia bacterium]
MLDEEATQLLNAGRYERDGYHAGHCARTAAARASDVELKMPKLKGTAFQAAAIGR